VIPFTQQDFFAVFASYNRTVWPAQVLVYGLAIILIALAIRRKRRPGADIPFGFALLWAWTGIFYHWLHFTAINRLAWAFGALFVIQAALFATSGLFDRWLKFGSPRGLSGWIGGLLLFYSLIAYPFLGLLGHPPAEVPALGVPCPTTIFTIGLLYWAVRPIPRYILVIPLLWAFVGSTAVLLLDVPQDLGLLGAGLFGLALLRPQAGATSSPAE